MAIKTNQRPGLLHFIWERYKRQQANHQTTPYQGMLMNNDGASNIGIHFLTMFLEERSYTNTTNLSYHKCCWHYNIDNTVI